MPRLSSAVAVSASWDKPPENEVCEWLGRTLRQVGATAISHIVALGYTIVS